MKGYCENKKVCRHKQIVSYFGEQVPWEKCDNTCDNCWPRDESQDHDEQAQVSHDVSTRTQSSLFIC